MPKVMKEEKAFYNRYWKDKHIKINPFDRYPEFWTEENFLYHLNFFRPYVLGRLLDYGCGNGDFLNKMSEFCESSYGVDLSEIAINSALKNYPKIEFRVLGEQNKIPYPDNYFDTICAIDVLEHVLDIEGVLEEINRVLKPKGHLLITTSQITRIKILLIALKSLDNYFYPTSPHIRYFTKRNLADILYRKGFEVIRYKKNRTYLGFIPQGQMVVASKRS